MQSIWIIWRVFFLSSSPSSWLNESSTDHAHPVVRGHDREAFHVTDAADPIQEIVIRSRYSCSWRYKKKKHKKQNKIYHKTIKMNLTQLGFD